MGASVAATSSGATGVSSSRDWPRDSPSKTPASLTVKVVPRPRVLCTETPPPSSLLSSRTMASPSPVPPTLRVVEPSTWRNFSKM